MITLKDNLIHLQKIHSSTQWRQINGDWWPV